MKTLEVFTLYLQFFHTTPTNLLLYLEQYIIAKCLCQIQILFSLPFQLNSSNCITLLNPSSSSRWTWRWGSAYLTPAKDQPFRTRSRSTPSLDSMLPDTDGGRSLQQDYDNSLWMSQQVSPLADGRIFSAVTPSTLPSKLLFLKFLILLVFLRLKNTVVSYMNSHSFSSSGVQV